MALGSKTVESLYKTYCGEDTIEDTCVCGHHIQVHDLSRVHADGHCLVNNCKCELFRENAKDVGETR